MIDQQQQVNVPELQRLNEAILLTMDAIRRVAPHLAQVQLPLIGLGGPTIDPVTAAILQQQAQQQALRAIYAQQQWGQPTWGQQTWGQPVWQQAYGQNPLQHLFGQQLGQQMLPQHLFAQPFVQQGFGGQFPVGQQYPQMFGQAGIGQQPYAQFGGQIPWQSPFGVPFGGQFPVAQQYASPVNYGSTQRPF